MSYGIECWNASGQKTLSLNRRLLRLHIVIYHNLAGRSNGTYTISVPGLVVDNTWAVIGGDSNGFYMQTGTVSYRRTSGGISVTIARLSSAITTGEIYFLVCRC